MKKKVFILSGVIGLLIIGIVIYNLKGTYAGRGCCSHHGGQNYCGSDGYWYCNDGTRSPSCTCSSYELTDTYTQNDTNNQSNDSTIDNKVYNAITDEQEENYEDNDEDNDSFINGVIVGGIISFVIYIIAKQKININ